MGQSRPGSPEENRPHCDKKREGEVDSYLGVEQLESLHRL